MIGTDRRLGVNPAVVAAELDGETVLLDVESGVYFGLDEVGSAIWQLLEEGLSADEITVRLIREYEVEAEVLRQDLAAFLALLDRHGLLASSV